MFFEEGEGSLLYSSKSSSKEGNSHPKRHNKVKTMLTTVALVLQEYQSSVNHLRINAGYGHLLINKKHEVDERTIFLLQDRLSFLQQLETRRSDIPYKKKSHRHVEGPAIVAQ